MARDGEGEAAAREDRWTGRGQGRVGSGVEERRGEGHAKLVSLLRQGGKRGRLGEARIITSAGREGTGRRERSGRAQDCSGRSPRRGAEDCETSNCETSSCFYSTILELFPFSKSSGERETRDGRSEVEMKLSSYLDSLLRWWPGAVGRQGPCFWSTANNFADLETKEYLNRHELQRVNPSSGFRGGWFRPSTFKGGPGGGGGGRNENLYPPLLKPTLEGDKRHKQGGILHTESGERVWSRKTLLGLMDE